MNWERDLIKYRREKAAETIEDARFLFEKGRLFSAVNRIYYALFYEINALLMTKNLSSHKHTGIRALFNKHFVNLPVNRSGLPIRSFNAYSMPLYIQ